MPVRTISDTDVDAIAAKVLSGLDYDAISLKVEERMVERFQLETGRAIWRSVKKWSITIIIWISALALAHGAGIDRPFVEAIWRSPGV